jgi:threonyl-tRNA synthetase
MLVVGENEEKDGTISVRRRSEGDLGVMKIEDFVAYFKEQSKTGFEFKA